MEIAITDRSFAALDLSAQTLASLEAMGYKAPTDVQLETIPRALGGKDLVVQSRTGTGKTAAFGIPIVERVDPAKEAVQAGGPPPPPGPAPPGAPEAGQDRRRQGGQNRAGYRGGPHGRE